MLRNTDSQVECHISFRRVVLKRNSEPRFSFYYSICRSYPYRKYCNDEKKKYAKTFESQKKNRILKRFLVSQTYISKNIFSMRGITIILLSTDGDNIREIKMSRMIKKDKKTTKQKAKNTKALNRYKKTVRAFEFQTRIL